VSLKVIHAVHASRIEPRLRFLASTLALYATDDGQDIYPGIATLMTATGLAESTIREGLQALVNSQLLVRDGFHGHTRRFRFDLERLAAYVPADQTRTEWREARQPYATAEGSNAQPNSRTLRHGGGLEGTNGHGTLRDGVPNPTPWRTEPYATADLTLRHGVVHIESQESQESQERETGAAAPASSEPAEAEDDNPEACGTNARSYSPAAAPMPFKVYAAIATQAITNSALAILAAAT